MQTLFETPHYLIYRNEGLTYLKNGVVNQINTGQCNALLNKLFGLNGEEAEKVLNNALPEIEVINELDKTTYEVHGRRFVDTNIYQKIYRGELMPSYLVRVKKQGKIYQGSFKTLDESRKYRNEIKGFIQPEPADKLKKIPYVREPVEKCIGKCVKGHWVRYRVRVYRNGRVFYKLTNTIEEARAYRDEVSKIKSVRHKKENEIL